jgi:hypothetical protein
MKANWNSERRRRVFRITAAVVAAAFGNHFIFAAPAYAQLGATPEQMVKFYGPVFRHNARIWHRQIYESSMVDGDIYQKGGVYVRAVFRQGRAVLLEFSRIDAALKSQEIDDLLSVNAEGSHWEMGKDSTDGSKFYRRLDELAVAQWAVGEDGSLLVSAEAPTLAGSRLLQ